MRESNLTQDELAFKSKVDRTYIGRIISAKANVTLKTLARIEAALGQKIF